MNAREVIDAIAYGKFSQDDLQGIIGAVKVRREFMAREKSMGLRSGSRVIFKSRRVGVLQGEVLKVNRKNLVVQCANGRWKVPVHMIELVKA